MSLSFMDMTLIECRVYSEVCDGCRSFLRLVVSICLMDLETCCGGCYLR